jgi:ATP-dependent DNA helicase RecG
VILIGVTDTGEIVGVLHHNRLKSEVQAIARSADPPISVIVESVGEVLCVTVPEQHSNPYAFGGKFFLRDGATSQQMSRDEIRGFFFKEGLIHFDETACPGYDLNKDLSPGIWDRFALRAGIPANMKMEIALRNLHLVKDGGMTYAGAWLLCDDITRYTLRAGVTCALFRGTTNVHILDRRDFSGDLYSIYADCMAYMQSRLNTALIPHARGRDERLELPEDALREALVNAIAHRDYRSTANVQVHIYHDRLEIITPGGLPAGMKAEDLGLRSVPRNPLLFSLFYRMNLVEKIGSGVQRIRDLCREYGVTDPKFDVSENWVTVVFHRVSGGEKMESKEQATGEVLLQPESEAQVEAQEAQVEAQEAQVPLQKWEIAMLRICAGQMATGKELLEVAGYSSRTGNFKRGLEKPLYLGLLEMTIPEKPRSSKQRYRLSEAGKRVIQGFEWGKS